jgi:hypothetical protein
MVGVTEIAGLASVLTSARSLLQRLPQNRLASEHQSLVAEALALVAEAGDRLLQIQTDVLEVQRENAGLIAQLEAADDWKSRIGGYTLRKTATGGVVLHGTNPFEHDICPTCAEGKKQIHVLQDDGPHTGSSSCPSCGKSYRMKEPETLSSPSGGWSG